MKKMFSFLAAVVCAAVVQAGTVNWNTGTVLDRVGNEFDENRACDVYYIVLDKSTAEIASGLGAADLYTQYAEGAERAGRTDYLSQADGKIEVAPQEDGKGYVLVLFAYTDGTKTYATGGVVTIDNPQPESGVVNPSSALNDSFVYFGGHSSWTAVPEPTTIALLALGLAVAGLKRKVA